MKYSSPCPSWEIFIAVSPRSFRLFLTPSEEENPFPKVSLPAVGPGDCGAPSAGAPALCPGSGQCGGPAASGGAPGRRTHGNEGTHTALRGSLHFGGRFHSQIIPTGEDMWEKEGGRGKKEKKKEIKRKLKKKKKVKENYTTLCSRPEAGRLSPPPPPRWEHGSLQPTSPGAAVCTSAIEI